MSRVTIQILDNGPLVVNGEVDLLDGNGKYITTKDQCFLCNCKLSSAAPYCDGTHKAGLEKRREYVLKLKTNIKEIVR